MALGYVFRSNDDVYLSLPKLITRLFAIVKNPVGVYGGYFVDEIILIRKDNAEIVNSKSSDITYPAYPSDFYPEFAQGNAYFLSADLANFVADSLILQPFRRLIADDILTAMLVESRINVFKFWVLADFDFDEKCSVCRDETEFKLHINVEIMHKVAENIRADRRLWEGLVKMCN